MCREKRTWSNSVSSLTLEMQGWHLRERRSSLPVVSMLPSLEMELLKCNHWNTLKPGILWCWDWSPLQMEKDLKIFILYMISWSQFHETKASQEHPSFNSHRWKSLIWAMPLLNPRAAGCWGQTHPFPHHRDVQKSTNPASAFSFSLHQILQFCSMWVNL